MEKIRLKCCPFCGCDQMTIRDDRDFVGYVYVECDQCHASGPYVDECDLGPSCPEDEIENTLKTIAAERWNCRPPMTDVYPEDLETLEDDLKLKGGALYGSSVYKD